MEHFTGRDGSFQFPDALFPPVQTAYPALPAAPTDKIEALKNAYQTSIVASQAVSGSSQHLSQFFRWARDVLDLHELHHGLDEVEVSFAKTVVQHTAYSESSEGAKSPFTGAAHYLLGLSSLFGSNTSSAQALEHFKQAAACGFARSYYRLAVEFEARGDVTHWKECLDRGAARGDSACCFRLAMALFQGQLGLQRDPNQAYELLQSAARVSDPDSPQPSYVLGLLLLGELPAIRIDGCAELESAVSHPTPQTQHVAFKNLERSAWLGFAPAQIRMGRAWQGGGKGFDSAIALRYFHHASRHYLYQCWRQGDVTQTSGEAELEVSKWFLSGCEVHLEANEPWAFRFGHVAAQAGNSTAEFALGYFYEVGISVKKSTADARFWYTEALKHGFTEARDRLDQIEDCPLDKSHHQKKLSLRRSNTKRLKDEFKEKLRSGRGGKAMRSYSVNEPQEAASEVTLELEEVEEGVEEGETADHASEAVSQLDVPSGVMASLQNLQMKDTSESADRMLDRIKQMKVEEDKRVEAERVEKERLEAAEAAEAAEKEAAEKAEQDAIQQAREEENKRRAMEAQRLAEAMEQQRLAEAMEQQRLEKEKLEQEEKDRREKEEAEQKALLEKERLAKEKLDKEQEELLEKERVELMQQNERFEEAQTEAEKEAAEVAEQKRLRKEHRRAQKKRAQSERLSAPVQPPPPVPSSIPKSNSADLRREKMLQNVRQRVSSESVNGTPPAPLEAAPLAPVRKQRVSSMIIDHDAAVESDKSSPTTPITASMRDIIIPASTSSSRSTTPHSGHSTPRKPVSRSGTDTDLSGRVVMNNMASPERRGRRHERSQTAFDATAAELETPPRLCSPAQVGGKRMASSPATPGMHSGSESPPVPPKDSPFDRSTYFDRSISPTKNRPDSPSGRVSSLSAVEISYKLKKFAGKMVPGSPPKRGGEFESSSRSTSPTKDRVASSPNPGRPTSALSGHSDTSRSSSPVDSIMSHSRSSTMMTSSSGNSMLGGFIPNMSMPSLANVKLPRASSPLKNPLSARDMQHVPVEPAPPRVLHGTGKGPRTFEEMGINPVTKEADDCVIM